MEKLTHYIKYDEQGKPIAVLYRTKEGYWVWFGVTKLDEDEQVRLMEQKDEKTK